MLLVSAPIKPEQGYSMPVCDTNLPISKCHNNMACGLDREAAAGHTGQFSWRAGPSGTVLAQHGSAPSTTGGPARGPWVNTGMVRARLAGLSFGPPAPAQPQVCFGCAF